LNMNYIELIKDILAYYGGCMFIYFGLHQVAAFFDKDTQTTSAHLSHLYILVLSIILALFV